MARRPRARPRLLVLGAGPAQQGLLEAARARGDLEVIAVDRDPQALGFPLADERAVLSTEDEDGIERLARARDVDGIVSPGADWTVGIAARVAARLGIPHPIEPAVAAVATSKLRQRDVFAAAGVPHPRAFAPDEVPSLPCVVKAPDRQGQRGLTLVTRGDDLAPALAAAASESRAGGVLVEEHVEGPEVTVNAFSHDGDLVPLTVTDRVTADPPAFGVALAHVWPTARDPGPAIEVARAAVEAVGIQAGPSYTQVRLGPDGPVVMEVAARLGGGHDAELCRVALGVDPNALAIAAALGEDAGGAVAAERVRSEDDPGGAAIVFLAPPAGRLVEVEGAAEAAAAHGVVWVRSYRRPGHVFGPFRRGADRAGAVLATGADREEALARARRAADAVRFRVDADAP